MWGGVCVPAPPPCSQTQGGHGGKAALGTWVFGKAAPRMELGRHRSLHPRSSPGREKTPRRTPLPGPPARCRLRPAQLSTRMSQGRASNPRPPGTSARTRAPHPAPLPPRPPTNPRVAGRKRSSPLATSLRASPGGARLPLAGRGGGAGPPPRWRRGRGVGGAAASILRGPRPGALVGAAAGAAGPGRALQRGPGGPAPREGGLGVARGLGGGRWQLLGGGWPLRGGRRGLRGPLGGQPRVGGEGL